MTYLKQKNFLKKISRRRCTKGNSLATPGQSNEYAPFTNAVFKQRIYIRNAKRKLQPGVPGSKALLLEKMTTSDDKRSDGCGTFQIVVE